MEPGLGAVRNPDKTYNILNKVTGDKTYNILNKVTGDKTYIILNLNKVTGDRQSDRNSQTPILVSLLFRFYIYTARVLKNHTLCYNTI